MELNDHLGSYVITVSALSESEWFEAESKAVRMMAEKDRPEKKRLESGVGLFRVQKYVLDEDAGRLVPIWVNGPVLELEMRTMTTAVKMLSGLNKEWIYRKVLAKSWGEFRRGLSEIKIQTGANWMTGKVCKELHQNGIVGLEDGRIMALERQIHATVRRVRRELINPNPELKLRAYDKSLPLTGGSALAVDYDLRCNEGVVTSITTGWRIDDMVEALKIGRQSQPNPSGAKEGNAANCPRRWQDLVRETK